MSWHCKQIPNGDSPIVVCEREDLVATIARLIATLTADLAAERAEIERLQAEASFWEREHQREQDAWRAERALADLLAEQLAWHDMADPALTTYQEARHD